MPIHLKFGSYFTVTFVCRATRGWNPAETAGTCCDGAQFWAAICITS